MTGSSTLDGSAAVRCVGLGCSASAALGADRFKFESDADSDSDMSDHVTCTDMFCSRRRARRPGRRRARSMARIIRIAIGAPRPRANLNLNLQSLAMPLQFGKALLSVQNRPGMHVASCGLCGPRTTIAAMDQPWNMMDDPSHRVPDSRTVPDCSWGHWGPLGVKVQWDLGPTSLLVVLGLVGLTVAIGLDSRIRTHGLTVWTHEDSDSRG